MPKDIERNVRNISSKAPVFDELQVTREREVLFEEHGKLVDASQIDPTSPYNPTAAVPLFKHPPRTVITRDEPRAPRLHALPISLPIDPLTHASFTEADRRVLQARRRRGPSGLFSGAVLLRLRYGTVVPEAHTLPWCLAYAAFDEEATNADGASLPFTPLFTTTQNLDGKWSPASSNLKMPLGSVLAVGLELTGASKLTAYSKSLVLLHVSKYDLNLEDTGSGGGGGS